MPHEIPPIIEPPKTLIGVGARELIILGVFGLLTISVFLFAIALPLRIGAGVFLALVGLVVAFGRDAKSGKPIEAVLSDRFSFASRVRFWQRGAQPVENGFSPATMEREDERHKPLHPVRGSVLVQAVPVNAMTWFAVASLAILAGLLAWIWLGGVQEILVWFPHKFVW